MRQFYLLIFYVKQK